jgi:hypothetical protein
MNYFSDKNQIDYFYFIAEHKIGGHFLSLNLSIKSMKRLVVSVYVNYNLKKEMT